MISTYNSLCFPVTHVTYSNTVTIKILINQNQNPTNFGSDGEQCGHHNNEKLHQWLSHHTQCITQQTTDKIISSQTYFPTKATKTPHYMCHKTYPINHISLYKTEMTETMWTQTRSRNTYHYTTAANDETKVWTILIT